MVTSVLLASTQFLLAHTLEGNLSRLCLIKKVVLKEFDRRLRRLRIKLLERAKLFATYYLFLRLSPLKQPPLPQHSCFASKNNCPNQQKGKLACLNASLFWTLAVSISLSESIAIVVLFSSPLLNSSSNSFFFFFFLSER